MAKYRENLPQLGSDYFVCYTGMDTDLRTPDQHDAYVATAWLRPTEVDGSLKEFLDPDVLPCEEHCG